VSVYGKNIPVTNLVKRLGYRVIAGNGISEYYEVNISVVRSSEGNPYRFVFFRGTYAAVDCDVFVNVDLGAVNVGGYAGTKTGLAGWIHWVQRMVAAMNIAIVVASTVLRLMSHTPTVHTKYCLI
jgi:hypothetical protein